MADEKLPKQDGILPGLPDPRLSPGFFKDAGSASPSPHVTCSDQQDKHPGETSSIAGLPSYGSYMVPSGQNAEVIHLYECGDCGIRSRYVRFYSLLTIIFVLFMVVWRVDEMMKCPRCMRNHIIVRLPLAILLSNLVSPIVVLWWLIMFIKTFLRPF